MRITRTLFIAGLLGAISMNALADDTTIPQQSIKDIMWKTCDYQLKLQAADKATSKADENYEWVRGAFYTGVLAAYRATKDDRYLKATTAYCEGRRWRLDKPDTRHADWQCIGQVYAEMFLMTRNLLRLQGIKQNIDKQMADPKRGRVDWWWCDALYMAPPVLTRMHASLGDRRYLEFLHRMYWDTWAFLYDRDEHLFYRDKNYFDAKSKNGKKVFWSRGNGWVLAGLARLLDYLPKDDVSRPKYENLFKDMSQKIASLQPADGLWRPSLLDADDVPTSETSGSAFFAYALAWGINNGLLDRAAYEPVVRKAWTGLAQAVTPEGKLGYVQKVAAAPGPVNPDDTREYAVGAFLQVGSELLKLYYPENK